MTLAPLPPSPLALRDDLVRDFLAGLSVGTRKTYSACFRALAVWRTLDGEAEAVRWFLSLGHGESNRTAAAWRGEMLEAGISPSTAELRISALRSLVTAANLAGERSWNLRLPPMRGAKVVRLRDTRGPGADVVAQLIAAADPAELATIRLMADRGLRCGEVASLRVADFDGSGIWTRGKGRGGQRERITLASVTSAAIVAWLASCAVRDPSAPMFPAWSEARKAGEMVGRLAKRAGVPHFRPHGLRHHAVTAAIRAANGDIVAAQKFSRHADPRTLLAYDDDRTDKGGELARKIAGEAESV